MGGATPGRIVYIIMTCKVIHQSILHLREGGADIDQCRGGLAVAATAPHVRQGIFDWHNFEIVRDRPRHRLRDNLISKTLVFAELDMIEEDHSAVGISTRVELQRARVSGPAARVLCVFAVPGSACGWCCPVLPLFPRGADLAAVLVLPRALILPAALVFDPAIQITTAIRARALARMLRYRPYGKQQKMEHLRALFREDKLVRPVGLIGKIIWAKLWLLAADHKRSRCIVKNCTKRCRKVTLSKYYY